MSETDEARANEPGPTATGAETDAAGADVATGATTRPDDVLLAVEDLRMEFGGITAVDGASFDVRDGSITGLIGPNGAGKSTTFDCVTGFYEPTDGTVRFQGNDVTGLRPDVLARRGLVRTFQIARDLSEMTVLENVMLAPRGQTGESALRAVVPGLRSGVVDDESAVRERAWETLEFFEIDHLAHQYAGNLSGGQRKLLEMARALTTDPEMVLLDEPLAGVNPTLERKLLDRVHELREDGLSFLLVEHDVDVIMNNCERIIVMHQGRVLAEGPPAAIRSNERVLEAYLGENV